MDIYQELKKAFDFYNQRLFHNELPECIFTLSRVSDTIGYFSPNRFIDNSNNTRHHEICLNPNYFGVLDCERTFAILVHEMVHMLQECRGERITTGYHNKAWSEFMISIGLIPTDTGKEGGKRIKYSCGCSNVWGKSGLEFICSK